MDYALFLTIIIVLVALTFDFTNGFHDASNSISTIVATRVLTPMQAVSWAAFFNFVALFIFDTGVAKTVGSGMIDLAQVTPPVVLAGLLGAIGWNLLTWWWKFPSSSSHALLGGYAGAAIMNRALSVGITDGFKVVILSGWGKTFLFIFLAPVIGWLLGAGMILGTKFLARKTHMSGKAKFFGQLQLLSSAFLSITHGGNDAQKTAGIIAGALALNSMSDFHIPYWVLTLSYVTIALGTLAGGWRIVKTMGFRLTKLDRMGGFSAESGAAMTILLATALKLPISTTHATTGSIIGIGVGGGAKVRWSLARRILLTWILTLPGSAALGAIIVWIVR